jgi:phytoene/squalene synthetase
MSPVHELLLPQSLSRAEAAQRCRAYLAPARGRKHLALACLPRESRDNWFALLAWHALVRSVAAMPDGFERRRHMEGLANELDAALEEHPSTPLGIALSFAIRRHELPEELLRRPLHELRRDEALGTFETREALLAHARAIAVPEGRLYLRLLGATSPRNEVLCDALAMALQLTAWLADLRGSFERGRLRIPSGELARAGVALGELVGPRAGPALRRIVQDQITWTRTFYAKGWDLCRALGPWRGRRLAFVLRWHAAELGALESAGPELLGGPAAAGWVRTLACGSMSLLWRGAPRLS